MSYYATEVSVWYAVFFAVYVGGVVFAAGRPAPKYYNDDAR